MAMTVLRSFEFELAFENWRKWQRPASAHLNFSKAKLTRSLKCILRKFA
jgi:hypothetical protein